MAITATAGNPIIVTGTTNTNDEVLTPEAGVFIKFVKWHVPSTDGHKAALKTKDGAIICEFECETDGESQWAPIFTRFENIYCDDQDSGALHIYIR